MQSHISMTLIRIVSLIWGSMSFWLHLGTVSLHWSSLSRGAGQGSLLGNCWLLLWGIRCLLHWWFLLWSVRGVWHLEISLMTPPQNSEGSQPQLMWWSVSLVTLPLCHQGQSPLVTTHHLKGEGVLRCCWAFSLAAFHEVGSRLPHCMLWATLASRFL